MDVRVVEDPQTFARTAGALYAADPVRHTVALTAMALKRPGHIMLTVVDGDELRGAALRTPPYPLIASGLPVDSVDQVAAVLAELDPDLPGVNGPREPAEAFAAAWAKRTGRSWHEAVASRLYRLDDLVVPTVPGWTRTADDADLPLLTRWWVDFQLEAHGYERDPDGAPRFVRQCVDKGDGFVLWEVDGSVVSMAKASAPIDGMSRIGPVYTPPEQRERGYGSAVTAAASRWGLDRGAVTMLLFTDLTNPTSNSIYQKLGYRPVFDTVELLFAGP